MPRERTAGSHGDEMAGFEPSGGRWLTIQEACAFLGVDQSTLRRWSDTGKVPVFRTPGGHRRYAEADLRALVGAGPRLQERPRVSRQTLTDRSLSGYEDDYLRVARERPWFRAYGAATQEEHRRLGRRLVDLAMRYASAPTAAGDRTSLLDEASTTAATARLTGCRLPKRSKRSCISGIQWCGPSPRSLTSKAWP